MSAQAHLARARARAQVCRALCFLKVLRDKCLHRSIVTRARAPRQARAQTQVQELMAVKLFSPNPVYLL